MERPLARGQLLPCAGSLVSAFSPSRRFEEAPQGTEDLALPGRGRALVLGAGHASLQADKVARLAPERAMIPQI